MADRPSIDFLIPYKNCFEITTRCIESIFKSVPNQNYKIVLIDDCSDNPNYLQTLSHHNKKIIPVRLNEPVGFAKAIEYGFLNSTSPHVMIMHNDVWFDNINVIINLQRSLVRLKSMNVKLVSARMDNLGSSCNVDSSILSKNKNDVIANNPLPLICCLMHRDLFKNIGGFIKPYKVSYFEEELYWRMKYYGYKQATCNAHVKHIGSVTLNEVAKKNPNISENIENDRKMCVEDIRNFV